MPWILCSSRVPLTSATRSLGGQDAVPLNLIACVRSFVGQELDFLDLFCGWGGVARAARADLEMYFQDLGIQLRMQIIIEVAGDSEQQDTIGSSTGTTTSWSRSRAEIMSSSSRSHVLPK